MNTCITSLVVNCLVAGLNRAEGHQTVVNSLFPGVNRVEGEQAKQTNNGEGYVLEHWRLMSCY